MRLEHGFRRGRGPRASKKLDFCERSEGKDVEGSLEGKASRDHDPVVNGQGSHER